MSLSHFLSLSPSLSHVNWEHITKILIPLITFIGCGVVSKAEKATLENSECSIPDNSMMKILLLKFRYNYKNRDNRKRFESIGD